MDLSTLYTEIILQHSRSSQNRRHLPCATCHERGHNPSCGDDIVLELQLEGGRVVDAAFTGQGCAISQASTSIMIDLIKGKTEEEARELAETFLAMIKHELPQGAELDVLGDAVALQGVAQMPARVKCAVLAWHTLQQAMKTGA
ncbi:MAG: nitrogen fixation protein NifU [Peptococcaceae bacterium 1109]|jgi:nitrogen fixation NifU-like protein|nr:MAG: nitrogen fixation protein NifU [Peptococcaceae bacterium 1109]